MSEDERLNAGTKEQGAVLTLLGFYIRGVSLKKRLRLAIRCAEEEEEKQSGKYDERGSGLANLFYRKTSAQSEAKSAKRLSSALLCYF